MNLAKTSSLIAVSLVAGTTAASAALVDFTDNTVGVNDGTVFGGYTLTGNPVAPNVDEIGSGSVALSNGASLAGDNDGVGVRDDEIGGVNGVSQSVTITFNKTVRLTAAYFLDLFVDSETSEQEEVHVSVGSSIAAAPEATLQATATHGTIGLGELTGLSLIGSSFTFSVSPFLNDGVGLPDASLAGIEVSPVPLPASILMLGAALGGLGALRRTRKS